MTSRVITSSPERTLSAGGRCRRISRICARLPDASFTATMPGIDAISSVVSASTLLAVRLGTL
jgi:hypothetical protein